MVELGFLDQFLVTGPGRPQPASRVMRANHFSQARTALKSFSLPSHVGWDRLMQASLYKPSANEKRQEVACEVCKGNRLFCIRNSTRCPVFQRAVKLFDVEKAVSKTRFFGPSPPGVFLGSFGYPNVLAGPLVPAVAESDPAVLDD